MNLAGTPRRESQFTGGRRRPSRGPHLLLDFNANKRFSSKSFPLFHHSSHNPFAHFKMRSIALSLTRRTLLLAALACCLSFVGAARVGPPPADPFADPKNDQYNPLRYIASNTLTSIGLALFLVVDVALYFNTWKWGAKVRYCIDEQSEAASKRRHIVVTFPSTCLASLSEPRPTASASHAAMVFTLSRSRPVSCHLLHY